MAQLIIPRPLQATALPAAALGHEKTDADGAFWCAAIGSGAADVLGLAVQIDALSQRAALLPVRASLTRPVVGQYLSMVKTLAAAWRLHSRPALLSSMGALVHFGATVGQSFTVEAIAPCRVDHGRAAQRVVEALQRRLGAPLAAFEALATDFASYRTQMARVSTELDADTRLVTQRLQADQVHVFLLSQQASGLQRQLDEGAMRERAGWPRIAAEQQELARQGCTLDALRRQLDQMRAEQADTRAEADYLQTVLPTVALYLGAVDRMQAGIADILAGLQALAARLAGLKQALAADPAGAAGAQLQLQAALPHWLALAAAAARVPV